MDSLGKLLGSNPYKELLDSDDLYNFEKLKEQIKKTRKSRKGHRVDDFSQILDTIKEYCIRNDDSDWKRCLMCGVAWKDGNLAINTSQLAALIGNSKSAVNGSLKRLGYAQTTANSECYQIVSEVLPGLKNDFSELRKWSVRQNIVNRPCPMVPRIDLGSYDKPPPKIEGSSQRINDSLSSVPKRPLPCPIFSIDKNEKMLWKSVFSDSNYEGEQIVIDSEDCLSCDDEFDIFDFVEVDGLSE